LIRVPQNAAEYRGANQATKQPLPGIEPTRPICYLNLLGSPDMPIYEYQCERCRRRSSILTLRVSEKVNETCQHCGSRKLRRLMSRFAMPRSEESRLESMAGPSNLADIDENDPKSVARMMRKMGREFGDELGGEEFDEAIDEIERGELGDDSDGSDDGDV
jgi:putative FmdB family regulatory protein